MALTRIEELRQAVLEEVTQRAIDLQKEVDGILDGRFTTGLVIGSVSDPSVTVWVLDSEGNHLLPIISRRSLDNLMIFVNGMACPGATEINRLAELEDLNTDLQIARELGDSNF